MKIATIDFESSFYDFKAEFDKVYPYGLDITVEQFVEMMDLAFIDAQWRDIHSLDLFSKLSGSVPTDPLLTMLSRSIESISHLLEKWLPNKYRVLPDRVEYVSGTEFKLYWREIQ